MKKVFDNEQAIKDYISRSAADPTNQFVNREGEPCLSYRHLKIQVGVSC